MNTLLVILVIAALAGGVFWNKRNAAAAMEGVRFAMPVSPQVVVTALRDAHCAGARATARSAVSGIRVTQVDRTSFRVDTRFGDVATVEVRPDGAGSIVSAHTDELYVGSPPAVHIRSGVMGLSSAVVHRICTLLGLSPGAARIRRFQRGIEGQLTRQLQRSAHT